MENIKTRTIINLGQKTGEAETKLVDTVPRLLSASFANPQLSQSIVLECQADDNKSSRTSNSGQAKRLFRWGADGTKDYVRMNSSRFDDDGVSHSIGSQYTIDTEDRIKLKKILQRVLYFSNSHKQCFVLDDMVEEVPVKLEDPNPDFKEGIFFVPIRNWGQIMRCREKKVSVKICVYEARSLFIFQEKSRFRQLVVNVTESTEFQNFTILVILLTTVTLIIYDYSDRSSSSRPNQILDEINTYSTYFYLLEFLFKIITQGVFMHNNSYFRDGWNWLDFLVVLSGLTEITNLPNVSVKGLRAFRVIRPLRSIRQFPRLRKLISGLISSITPLLNALLFMFFVFIQFSIFASYQFAGAYYNRCRLPGGVVDGVWPIDPTQHRLCSKTGNGYTCLNESICGEPSDVGLDYLSDPLDFETDYRITNFDNPLSGLLTIFQCITLDGWSAIMYNIKDQQQPALVVIFFVLLVIAGAFFLIHMVLAVISYSISQFESKEVIEENLKKKNLSLSLKRKEKQLKLDQKKEFQAELDTQKSQKFQEDEKPSQIELSDDIGSETQRGKVGDCEQPPELILDLQLIDQVATAHKLQKQDKIPVLSSLEGAQLTNENLIQQSTDREDPEVKLTSPTNNVKTLDLPARTQKNRFYLFFYKVCMNPVFSVAFTFIIVVNAFIMTQDRFPEPKNLSPILDLLNQICSWLFTIEMVIKLIGLGPVVYARDSFNLFDAFIVIMSIVDNVMFSISGVKIGGGVIVLRSIRLLRVFKLARNWTSFRVLLARIMNTLPNMATFGFLLLIFIVVFTILGMQFFAGTVFIDKYNNIVPAGQGQPPLNNFESLFNATSTVFVVMMIDNWHLSMFDYYRKFGIAAQIYFIAVISVLNFILLNLFLALIIENFDDSNEGKDNQDSDQLKFYSLKGIAIIRKLTDKIPFVTLRQKVHFLLQSLERYICRAVDGKTKISDPIMTEITKKMEILGQQNILGPQEMRDRVKTELDSQVGIRKRQLSIASQVKNDSQYLQEETNLVRQATVIAGKTLHLFDFDHPLRKLCGKIYDHRFFETCSNIVVVFNTILLALDNPLDDPLSKKQRVLTILDFITTGVFTIEAIIKIILFGFVFNGKHSYIRLPWNVLDFVVVGVSLFSYLPLGTNLQFYKAMRMLRILRPLRMIQRNQGLRIAIKSLFNMLPGVLSLVLISCINMGLMAVLGVNLFMGTFYSCNMSNIPVHQHAVIQNMWDCMDHGGEWVNQQQNFDNFQQAFITVFQITNVENWYSIASSAQQKTEIFQTPRSMASPASMIYFVIVILIQAVFMFNLFVQVVISIFNLEKEKLAHSTYLTTLEFEYIDTCIKCYKISPKKLFTSTQPISRFCYKFTEWKVFQYFIFVCILVNSVLLGTNWYGQSKESVAKIEFVNIALIGIFTFEVVLKIVAHRLDFFKEGWNLLDLVVVLFGIAGYLIELFLGQNYTLAVTVIRMFKVTRLFKLVRALGQLQQISLTFLQSLGEILNIGSLLFLFLFMFVILAINLFSQVKLQTYLNYDVNFESFGVAFLSLFRASTGEDWTNLMADLSRQPSIAYKCQAQQTFEQMQQDGIQGCGSQFTYVFFTVFQVVLSFVMFNLFTAIILEGFSKALLNDTQRLKPETLQQFQQFWQKYDPKATGMIKFEDLEKLLLDLVCQEVKIQSQRGVIKDEILFNFRHKKVLKLSAIWHMKENDGSKEYQYLLNNVFFQRQLQRYLRSFIGDLEIPTYNKIQNFNFYDVLISFVDFQFSQRHKQEFTLRSELKKELKKTSQVVAGVDKIALYSEQYFNLPRREKELLFEKENEDFIHVIHSIEEKSQRQDIQILKLIELKQLKRKNAKRNSFLLDDLDGQVITSKYIQAVRVIERAILFVQKKRINKKKQQLPAKEVQNQSDQTTNKKRLKIIPQLIANFKNNQLRSLSSISESVWNYLRAPEFQDPTQTPTQIAKKSGFVVEKIEEHSFDFDLEDQIKIGESSNSMRSDLDSSIDLKTDRKLIPDEDELMSNLCNPGNIPSSQELPTNYLQVQPQIPIANTLVLDKNQPQQKVLKKHQPTATKFQTPLKIKQPKISQGKLKAETVKVYGKPPMYSHLSKRKQRPIKKVFNDIVKSNNRFKIMNASKRLYLTKLGPARLKKRTKPRQPQIQLQLQTTPFVSIFDAPALNEPQLKLPLSTLRVGSQDFAAFVRQSQLL